MNAAMTPPDTEFPPVPSASIRRSSHATDRGPERALLAQAVIGRRDTEEAADSLAELARLAETAGAVVVGQVTQRRPQASAATLIGSGKLEELQAAIRTVRADTVFFDNDLSPMQVNNLDTALGVKVIDRTELILQIFARRAQSAEARIQVELAQLRYLVTRLPTSEKQARFTGGIGMKGPGESPLQLRNAPMRRRIGELKRRLEEVQARQERTRQHRKWPQVSLVGYTNVGKSTLLNSLAKVDDAYVDDRLFATLDTKTRLARFAGGRHVLLTDTVGFIRNIPHDLVASFRSTLDVARNANLLLVVADAAAPMLEDHIRVTLETLRLIGADNVPSILVLNKADKAESTETLLHATERYPNAIPVSAQTGQGLDALRSTVVEELQQCYPLWRPPSAISAT
jgi:GTP-binding protein HflX